MDYNCGILMIKEITLIEKSIQLGQKNDVNYACTKKLLIVECKLWYSQLYSCNTHFR